MPKPIKVTATLEAVARWFDVSVKAILGNSRLTSIARARHVAMYLLYKHTQMSYPEVGKLFDRDHTSVLHAVRRVGRYDFITELDINEIYAEVQQLSFPEVET